LKYLKKDIEKGDGKEPATIKLATSNSSAKNVKSEIRKL